MEKTLFAAALASVALAGCVKNETEITPNADSPITFAAPLVSSITRVYNGEITNPYPEDEKFVVFANLYLNSDYNNNWADGTTYFGAAGLTVAYDSTVSGWLDVNHPYYWPKNGKLTFYAYSPAEYTNWKLNIVKEGDTEYANTGSAVNIDAHNVDLLYSELAKDKIANDNTNGNNVTPPTPGTVGSTEYNGVELKFKHALSSIKFKVKTAATYNNASFKLNGIVLKSVKPEGTFKCNLTTESSVPAWELTEKAAKDYPVITSAGQDVTAEVAEVSGIEGDNAMILLPQNLTGVKAEVSYTMTTGAGEFPFTTEIDLGTLSYTGQTAAEWIAGKRYIYTIIFTLDKIYFDPSVKDWDNVNVTVTE